MNTYSKNKGQEVNAWLKSQSHAKAQLRDVGSTCLEPEQMKELAEQIDKQLPELAAKAIKLTLQVKWSLLYKVMYIFDLPLSGRFDLLNYSIDFNRIFRIYMNNLVEQFRELQRLRGEVEQVH